MKIHYLDNNATTRIDDEVLKAMMPYLTDNYANASGIYSFGQDARKAVEESRATAAKFFNADDPREIIFTSGGTESDNIAVRGAALANSAKGKTGQSLPQSPSAAVSTTNFVLLRSAEIILTTKSPTSVFTTCFD